MGYNFEKYKKELYRQEDVRSYQPGDQLSLRNKLILEKLGYKVKNASSSKKPRLRLLYNKNRGADDKPKQSKRVGK